MRTDAQSRIMSLSFERDPQEHVHVMFNARRRFIGNRPSALTSMAALWFFIYAAGFGLGMELYRRYVLVHLTDISNIPPFSVAMLQVFPVFIAIWLLLWWHNRIDERRSAKAVVDRLEKTVFIDVDIFRDGIQAATIKTLVQVDWTAIRDIHFLESRIEFISEAWMFFIPFRAFQSREDYGQRAKEIQAAWEDAVKAGTATT